MQNAPISKHGTVQCRGRAGPSPPTRAGLCRPAVGVPVPRDASPAWLAKPVRHTAVREHREPPEGHRRPRCIVAELLEPRAITAADHHTRVDVEPAHLGAPRALPLHGYRPPRAPARRGELFARAGYRLGRAHEADLGLQRAPLPEVRTKDAGPDPRPAPAHHRAERAAPTGAAASGSPTRSSTRESRTS
jgi:hypothetical protein